MNVYLYDGSFEGLLTAIFYAYGDRQFSDIKQEESYQPDLLSTARSIVAEEDKAQRVLDSVNKQLSFSVLDNLYSLYLSEIDGCERLALQYLKLCYRYSANINLAKHNQIIYQVDSYRHKLRLEAQRMKGFVRFHQIGPMMFYAKIEPDHNILPLLMHHFTTRFSDQYFIIHDLKRQYGLVYDQKSAYFIHITQAQSQELAHLANQDQYEQLFKIFFNAINIPERQNHKQQLSYMPKRYWKHLYEVNL